MKITSKQKMAIVVALFVLVGVAAVVLFILPQFSRLDALAQERATAESQRQQAQAVLAQLEEAKGRAAVTEAQLLKIGTEMPDAPQLPTLIIELQDLANASGVQVTSFAPSQPTPVAGAQLTEMTLTTQLTAKWDDLLDYLRRLNGTTRLIRVTNVTINPATSSSDSTATSGPISLSVSLTMKAYVLGTNGTGTSATGTPVPVAQ